MKKTLAFLISISVAFYIGANTHITKEVKVKSVDNTGTKIVTEYTDGSFSVVKDGVYHFQPVDMGDWDYTTTNKEDFNNLVSTYLDNRN